MPCWTLTVNRDVQGAQIERDGVIAPGRFALDFPLILKCWQSCEQDDFNLAFPAGNESSNSPHKAHQKSSKTHQVYNVFT